MTKLLATAMVAAMIASLGAALAQVSASHGVTVNIPAVLMIRLTLGPSSDAVERPYPVVFNLLHLTAATFEPKATHHPVDPLRANWNDVRVFVNRPGSWSVNVATNNKLFPWARVRVTPFPSSGVSVFHLPAVPGPTGATTILTSTGHTLRWRSLGIGPVQFSLDLDGTEPAGTFSTTVIYSITNP